MRKGIFGLAVVIALAGIVGTFGSWVTAQAAGGPTMYASFDGHGVKGIVEVQRFGSGLGSDVVAHFKRPRTGVVVFCLTRADGSKTCSTVENSSFGRTTDGCAKFTITFNPDEQPTRVEIFTVSLFGESLSKADLVEREPTRKEMRQLNQCR